MKLKCPRNEYNLWWFPITRDITEISVYSHYRGLDKLCNTNYAAETVGNLLPRTIISWNCLRWFNSLGEAYNKINNTFVSGIRVGQISNKVIYEHRIWMHNLNWQEIYFPICLTDVFLGHTFEINTSSASSSSLSPVTFHHEVTLCHVHSFV